jgi:hypothetical protein
MFHRLKPALLICLLFVFGCARTEFERQFQFNSENILEKSGEVSDRLFFGRNIPGGGEVSDSAWNVFLAEEITPRFPNGLTLWRAEGQWANSDKQLIRENVFVVELFHKYEARIDSLLEVIAENYRIRFKQEAVLRLTQPARMQFYEGENR